MAPYLGIVPPQLVLDVLSELDGAYGLLVKSSHYPGELVAAKKGSPLIIGIKDRHVKVGNAVLM